MAWYWWIILAIAGIVVIWSAIGFYIYVAHDFEPEKETIVEYIMRFYRSYLKSKAFNRFAPFQMSLFGPALYVLINNADKIPVGLMQFDSLHKN